MFGVGLEKAGIGIIVVGLNNRADYWRWGGDSASIGT